MIDHVHSGPVIGVGQPMVTEKKNKDFTPVPGAYLIRSCENCDLIFSKQGSEDMIGIHKVPVQNQTSLVFIDSCAKGCRPSDLFVTYFEREGQEVDDFIIGCNFCGYSQAPMPLVKAIRKWDSLQRNIRTAISKAMTEDPLGNV